MRVTDSGNSFDFLQEVTRLRAAVDRANSEVSSGRKLQRPSDDPVGAGRSLILQASSSRNDQYLTNAQRAQSRLEHTDTIIENIQGLLNKSLELTVQGLSGSTTAESRAILASQVSGLRDRLIGLANSTFQGSYLFSGSATTTIPYTDAAGVVTYNGNTEKVFTRVDDAFLVQTNLPGPDLFAAVGDVFGILKSIEVALGADDTTTLQQNLQDLRSVLSNSDVERGKVAASLNYLEGRVNTIQSDTLRLKTERSNVEDANIVDAILRLNQGQTALQAAISANSRLLNVSLLDFLR